MASKLHSDVWRWPDFKLQEFACRHCGETYFHSDFFDRLQRARSIIGRPFVILSGHRCALHNAHVGGAPLSQHLTLAVDISAYGHDRLSLLKACQRAGFTGFGYYQTFLHIDLGRSRQWWSDQTARDLWLTL
jgi:zinc D-Ala-D-Ala carboxypeptidase